MKYKIEIVSYWALLLIGLYYCNSLIPNSYQFSFQLYAAILIGSMLLVSWSELSFRPFEKGFIFWSGIFVLGSVMAFRSQFGIDDPVYMKLFNRAGEYSYLSYLQSSDIEKGFLSLDYLLYYITAGNYNIAQPTITFLSFMFWGFALRAQGKVNIPFMLIILWSHYYFFILSAGIVRMFIVIPIVLYATQFIWKCNLKKYVLVILFASLFHISALIMLLFVFFIIKHEWAFKRWWLFLVIIAVLVAFVFLGVGKYLIPILGERYSGYILLTGNFSILLGSFDTLPIVLVALYFKKYFNNLDEESSRRYVVGIVLLILSIVFSVASTMLPIGRIIYYANLGIMIVFSSIFAKRSNNIIDYGAKCLLIIYALVYVMHTNFLNEDQNETLFPYTSLWS